MCQAGPYLSDVAGAETHIVIYIYIHTHIVWRPSAASFPTEFPANGFPLRGVKFINHLLHGLEFNHLKSRFSNYILQELHVLPHMYH